MASKSWAVLSSDWSLSFFCFFRKSHLPFSKCFFSEFLNTNFFSQSWHWKDSLGPAWQSKWRSNLSLVLDRWGQCGQAKGRLLWAAITWRLSSVNVRKLMGHWEHFSPKTSPAWTCLRCNVKSYRVGHFCRHCLQKNPLWFLGGGAWSCRVWACSPDFV